MINSATLPKLSKKREGLLWEGKREVLWGEGESDTFNNTFEDRRFGGQPLQEEEAALVDGSLFRAGTEVPI